MVKIQSCVLLVWDLYFLRKYNIFNNRKKSYEWILIKNKMKRIKVSNKKNINDTLDEMKSNLSVAFCSMSKLQSYLTNNSFIDLSMRGVFMTYYYIKKEEAKYEGDKFLINPVININQQIFILTEKKESKKFIKVMLPFI